MSERIPITSAGLTRLRDELKRLEREERPKISHEIEVARGHGDLRENSEYHAAKEKQGHIEGRILDLTAWISNAEVIDTTKFRGETKVMFGATVKTLDMSTEKETTYRIVGELEADLKRRWISVTSPLARGLIGKSLGDTATVESPGGTREYEILAVDFLDEV